MNTCKNCLMDETAIEIKFDSLGVCNYCKDFKKKLSFRLSKSDDKNYNLDKLINKIKSSNRSDYSCVVGVSGGVDSTYLCIKLKELGLNPLAVHFDNGWNSELSVINIEKTLKKLDIDLVTIVVDWEEFKDIQKSFLEASTPDGEIPTDHAILACLFDTANKYNIKYVISGYNYSEEGLMPSCWAYGHIDWKYIKGVHKKLGKLNITSYPHISFLKLFYYTFIKRIKRIALLNYLDYSREAAQKIIIEHLEYKPYGWKHHESIYTRFFQSYILPVKFNIDKRKAHISALICSGEISLHEGKELLNEKPYGGEMLENDIEFVLKKLGYTKDYFNHLMKVDIKSFKDYENNYRMQNYIRKFINFMRNKGLLGK